MGDFELCAFDRASLPITRSRHPCPLWIYTVRVLSSTLICRVHFPHSFVGVQP
jgi:hypothetical protein